MLEQTIRIDLRGVDLDSLHSEADFRRKATRLLPKILTEIGEAQGELAWDQLLQSFHGIPGFKGNNSSSDRQNFISEAGENFRQNSGPDDRAKIVDHIVAQLQEQANREGPPMPISYNEKEKQVLRFLKQEYLTKGGRPETMDDEGGSTKALVMQNCSLDEIGYREIMGRFEHFGFARQIAKGAWNEWVNIDDSILEAVRSLDEKPATSPTMVSNTVNVGTMNNSAIQQSSPGAMQNVTISTQDRTDVEKILAGVANLMGRLALSSTEADELQAEIDTIKAQLKKGEPKRSLIKDCLIAIRSSLEKVAAKVVAAGAATLGTELVQQISALITNL